MAAKTEKEKCSDAGGSWVSDKDGDYSCKYPPKPPFKGYGYGVGNTNTRTNPTMSKASALPTFSSADGNEDKPKFTLNNNGKLAVAFILGILIGFSITE